MDKFLPHQNELGKLINAQAADLYHRLRILSIEDLGLPYYCLEYFKSSHYKRLFFSIETSAHLLYHAINLKKKPVREIILMDYGAGVGSLYMLAKMIGCKVIYNDHLEDWKISASLIASAIGIHVDHYVVGDIEATLETLKDKNIMCDIITSRNVLEHIYKLDNFYKTMTIYQPAALIYSSTTANYYNPAAHIKHILWHRKWERHFGKQRSETIRKLLPSLAAKELHVLSKATRGLAMNDLNNAITEYFLTKKLPDPRKHYTNTCDPSNGVWAEHLLTFTEYRNNIPEFYTVRFYPRFWDTHYANALKNIATKLLNVLIGLNRRIGFIFAPFIYVVADPKSRENKK